LKIEHVQKSIFRRTRQVFAAPQGGRRGFRRSLRRIGRLQPKFALSPQLAAESAFAAPRGNSATRTTAGCGTIPQGRDNAYLACFNNETGSIPLMIRGAGDFMIASRKAE
jgi:hypothetical protein